MSPILNLTPSHPRPAWVDSFMMRLGELAPEMSPTDALHHAEGTFDEAADLDPLEAAEIFALEMPPAEVGAP